MKDKELNEKESLELIARMIRNTRRNLDTGSGNSFLVWGYVGVLVTLAVWAGVTFTGNLTKPFCLCVPSSSRWAASLRVASFAILRFLSSRCLAFCGD